MIAEHNHASALASMVDIMDEVVLLNPTRALVIPRGSQQHWECRVTDLFVSNPAAAILKIAWRKSRHHGRTWVKPMQLDSQIRAARARAREGLGLPSIDGDPTTSALLVLRGPMGVDPDGLLMVFTQKILEEAGLTLRQHTANSALPDLSWAAMRDGGGAWTGTVRLKLVSQAQVMKLHQTAREVVVCLHGERRRLEVHNAFLDPSGAVITAPRGNGRGQQ